MPHGYTLDIDSAEKLQYSKRHQNGERTVVDVTKDIPGEDWRVKVTDPRGNVDLGTYGAKTDARDRATRFMRDNPKGVPAEDKGIPGTNTGIPGMDGNGLF